MGLLSKTFSRRTALAGAGLLLAGGVVAPAYAQDSTPHRRTPVAVANRAPRLPNYDSRKPASADGTQRRSSDASSAAVRALRGQLGAQGIVAIDAVTGTPRRVARLDGFLTAPSRKAPAKIVLDYVRAHAAVFGIDAAAVSGLMLRKDYVDVAGTHHLSFVQMAGAVPVFGNGLKGHVTKNGRLVQIDGSPVRALATSRTAPALSAAQARAKAVTNVSSRSAATATTTAADNVRTTKFSDGGNAKLVMFDAASGLRLAWQTLSRDDGYLHIIDAATGQVLYRHDLVAHDHGTVWSYYPGAKKGGKARTIDLSPWLPNGAPRLAGNVAHVWSDLNGDEKVSAGEEIRPARKGSFSYPFTRFGAKGGTGCGPAFPCSWDPAKPYSWRVNRAQTAVQLYSFLGTWHDHLAARPIGFTRQAGNFEAVDGDAVQAGADVGADSGNGLPDEYSLNQAFMGTFPDGIAPKMSMFLFHSPDEGIGPTQASNEADIIFHEYTHGMAGRLVVDAGGVSTLTGVQAGAMNEGWADWYPLSYLVDKGLEEDRASFSDVLLGRYISAGKGVPFRSEPIDCPVTNADLRICAGNRSGNAGGYTYGDFGRIAEGPEPHADGEIWGQTLWDLRTAIGSKKAESLITRAMELSPANPSFLDQRDSILQADLILNSGKLRNTIWRVFAARGMGFHASSRSGNDPHPTEDFSLPPGTPRQ